MDNRNLPGTDLPGWYERGQYTMKAPPVCTAKWTVEDWKRYVTPNPSAPFPLAPIQFNSLTLYHVGENEKGEAVYAPQAPAVVRTH